MKPYFVREIYFQAMAFSYKFFTADVWLLIHSTSADRSALFKCMLYAGLVISSSAFTQTKFLSCMLVATGKPARPPPSARRESMQLSGAILATAVLVACIPTVPGRMQIICTIEVSLSFYNRTKCMLHHYIAQFICVDVCS